MWRLECPQHAIMKRFDALRSLEIEEARSIIALCGPLTIQDRTNILADRMSIDCEHAHELLYIIEGWRPKHSLPCNISSKEQRGSVSI